MKRLFQKVFNRQVSGSREVFFRMLLIGSGVIGLFSMISGCSSTEASSSEKDSEGGNRQTTEKVIDPLKISSETVDQEVVRRLVNGGQLNFATPEEFADLRDKVLSRPLNKVIDLGDNAQTQAKLNELSIELNRMFAHIRRVKFAKFENEFDLQLMVQKPMKIGDNAEEIMNSRVDEFVRELSSCLSHMVIIGIIGKVQILEGNVARFVSPSMKEVNRIPHHVLKYEELMNLTEVPLTAAAIPARAYDIIRAVPKELRDQLRVLDGVTVFEETRKRPLRRRSSFDDPVNKPPRRKDPILTLGDFVLCEWRHDEADQAATKALRKLIGN